MSEQSVLKKKPSILIGKSASRTRRLCALAGHSVLLLIASSAAITVFFIFFYIIRDALPFFRQRGFMEFFTSKAWYPSGEPAQFGALTIFLGSLYVTVGAAIFAVPVGISAAVCLSDILPFSLRQIVKPVIEILAAIPSVAYGFFALVVLAPMLQERGGGILSVGVWLLGVPAAVVGTIIASDMLASAFAAKGRVKGFLRPCLMIMIGALCWWGLSTLSGMLSKVVVPSGVNALNVSIILGLMALPTVVSVSEDALTAAGRELREGSYALGATRAETIFRVVIPAARSGIIAAVILGVMRAIGETMVVLMASGNAAQIPEPWYNLLEPVRTLTATIAGDMGEADQSTGSARYHVLFAMAMCLLVFSFLGNMISEIFVRRSERKAK